MLVRTFQIHIGGVTGEFRTHVNYGEWVDPESNQTSRVSGTFS
ncbi:Uncharacterised protein [Klebsiella pneumoniae]|uniref:Uncharacterized protein n=1 Tax=Klebsiella pneumoniae TaxID=573 RepID=A0A378BBX6_KLEPN|nr:Uncharacterised protein [Klebsiella pneumoniae]